MENTISTLTETALLDACRTLFGDELLLSRDFLNYLQPTGVKAAYRLKAKEAHPDRFVDSAPHIHKQQTALFQEVNKAYDLLRSFFQERDKPNWTCRPGSHHRARANAAPSEQTHARPSRSSRNQQQNSCRIPERTLEFGHYLYHRGLVSYTQLINALVWQRQQRPALGQLAVNLGWLKKEDTLTISQQRGPYARFGEKAIRLGLLSPGQVKALILHQRTMHKKLGQYFVEMGILSAEEIEHFAGKLAEHNTRVFNRPGRYKQAL